MRLLFSALFGLLLGGLNAQHPNWQNFHYANNLIGGGETPGKVWLANTFSVLEFELGTERLTVHDKARTGFTFQVIWDFAVGPEGRVVCLGDNNKLSIYQQGVWRHLEVGANLGDQLIFELLGWGADGRLYAMDYSREIYAWTESAGMVKQPNLFTSLVDSPEGGTFDAEGRLWLYNYRDIGYWADGVFHLVTPAGIHYSKRTAFSTQGELWMLSDAALHHWRDGHWETKPLADALEFDPNWMIPTTSRTVLLMNGSKIVEGRFMDGEWSFADIGGQFNPSPLLYLQSYFDGAEKLWFLHQEDGALWRWSVPQGESVRITYPSWLPISESTTVGVGPDGRVWAGGWNGIAYLDGGRWKRHVEREDQHPFLTFSVNAFLFDRRGMPTVGTGNFFVFGFPRGDILRWNEAAAQWDTMDLSGLTFRNQPITILERDQDGNLWCAGGDQRTFGVHARGRWFEFSSSDLPFSANFFRCFEPAPQGGMWIGTDKGLLHYDGFRFRSIADSVVLDLGPSGVTGIYLDRRGDLWVSAGENGPRHYRDGQWVSHRPWGEGVFWGSFTKIVEDGQGHIWTLTTGNGVFRYDGQNWRHFNAENSGLHSNYIYDLAADHRGRVWFAGVAGISRFSPEEDRLEVAATPAAPDFGVYPNPSCCRQTVRFALPEGGEVQLHVYNMEGRLVRTLLSRVLPAGEHTHTWSPSGLPAGVYHLRLQSPAGSITLPIVIRE